MLRSSVENFINEKERNALSCSIGVITNVYIDSYSADVSINDNGRYITDLKKVPLPRLGDGLYLSPPKVGTKVLIAFLSKSMLQGKILSVYDDTYRYITRNNNQHTTQGTYISFIDYDELRKNTEELSVDFEDTPLYSRWVDEENDNSQKYLSFLERDPTNELIESVSKLSNFQSSEVGFFHTDSQSLVKIRKNGVIDIFTRNNNGIRVNPIDNSISILSDKLRGKVDSIKLNCEDFEVNSKNFTINSDNLNLLSANLVISDEDSDN